ncbi:putative thimidylate synthase [Sinorhizobium phage phiM9]|uniref:Putative thimidylate synthase n=1 Tax=Sinorhizobium phage phiM9 TaxID=1636182 RepID=A0A0F6TGX0_9CAUD|nr:putative thimidylate synthase [Sinorhizobium phage phiM9]AKE44901.1 putative thimidylate synthase [Sinorhizobium phage phiM9]
MNQYNTFGKIFRDTIEEICSFGDFKESRIGKTCEIRNLIYTVNKHSTSSISNFEGEFDDLPAGLRRPHFEYGHAFSDWVISGSDTMPQSLKDLNPVAAKYDAKQSDLSTFELPVNFSMFYGPRVTAQFGPVSRELKANRDTRRAYISVLDGMNDNKLLDGLRQGELPTVEYPCTIGFQFDVDENNDLNMTVHMRSQNMISVWPYDYLIDLKLLHKMAETTGYNVGTITGVVTSAHIYERDFEYAGRVAHMEDNWWK